MLQYGETRGSSILTLDGSSSNLSNLDELNVFPNIQELTLKNLNLDNINGLQYLINLKKIWISNTTISNYTGFNYCNTVTELYFINNSINNANIKTVTDSINNMESLKLLKFRNNNELTKIPALDTLGATSYLWIEENANLTNIYGLSTVQDKTKITEIYLNENNLTDVVTTTEVNSTYNYKKPLINDDNVINLSYLAGYTNVEKIQLTAIGNGYSTYHDDGTLDSSLRHQKNLKYLAGIDNNEKIVGINKLSKLKKLDLYSCDILDVNVLKEFEEITPFPLNYLDLRLSSNMMGSQITYVSSVLNKVTSLYLDANYSAILGAKENWNLSYSNITDLSFLEGNTITTNLNISHNYNLNNEQAQYIGCLTQLKSLSMQYCTGVTDYSFLASLPNLEFLDLHGAKINETYLMMLPNKNKLTQLFLYGCTNMSSIDWLANFPNVGGNTMFDMTNWKLSNTTDLSIFDTRTKKFNCVRTNVGDITTMQKQISACTSSLGLHLRGNTNLLSKIEECKDITYLMFSCGDSDYANDNYFNGENTLDLSACSELKSFYFKRSAIEHIITPRDNLAGDNNLEKVTVFDMNKGTEWEIPDFSDNENLYYINLNKNYISQSNFVQFINQISPIYENSLLISGCPNLNTLYLNNNCITSLNPLDSLEGCTEDLEIYITDNQLVTLSGIENLTQLVTLDIQNNPGITNIQPIIDLASKTESKLTTVNIRNCSGILNNPDNISMLEKCGLEVKQ